MAKKNEKPTTENRVLIVNADDVTVDDLLKLEEAKTIREMIDAFVRFTGHADDPEAAEAEIRKLTLSQLLRERSSLIEQFNELNEQMIPN